MSSPQSSRNNGGKRSLTIKNKYKFKEKIIEQQKRRKQKTEKNLGKKW